MDRKIIDQYEAGATKLQAAIKPLSRDALLWKPSADLGLGQWSIQQIIIHLLDSDLIWASRMKAIIAEDNPTILPFDENRFATSLFYEIQDPHKAMELMDLNRRQFARVLRKLPDSAFLRTGQHEERGSITLGQSLEMMVQHVDHHLAFIEKKGRHFAAAGSK